MSFRDIQLALDVRLSQVAYPVAIANENTVYKPVAGTPWIRPTVLNARGETLDLDNANDSPGVYQIDLFYPLNKGTSDLLSKLDDIAEYFAAEKTLTFNQSTILIRSISKLPSRIDDNTWFAASLEIIFNSYTG